MHTVAFTPDQVPAKQFVQSPPEIDQVPAKQSVQVLEPAGEDVPAEQFIHTLAPIPDHVPGLRGISGAFLWRVRPE